MSEPPERFSPGWVRAAVQARHRRLGLGDDADGWLGALLDATEGLMDGSAALVVVPPGGPSVMASGSSGLSHRLAELERTAGEGPATTAADYRRAVLVPDVKDGARDRWPGYCAVLDGLEVRAVFAFPITVGAAVLGVLVVWRSTAGDLDPTDVRVSYGLTDLATEMLVDDLEQRGDESLLVGEIEQSTTEIYQAQGMVMVQAEVHLDEALSLMRAHAFTHDLELKDVAHRIVTGRLRLRP